MEKITLICSTELKFVKVDFTDKVKDALKIHNSEVGSPHNEQGFPATDYLESFFKDVESSYDYGTISEGKFAFVCFEW